MSTITDHNPDEPSNVLQFPFTPPEAISTREVARLIVEEYRRKRENLRAIRAMMAERQGQQSR